MSRLSAYLHLVSVTFFLIAFSCTCLSQDPRDFFLDRLESLVVASESLEGYAVKYLDQTATSVSGVDSVQLEFRKATMAVHSNRKRVLFEVKSESERKDFSILDFRFLYDGEKFWYAGSNSEKYAAEEFRKDQLRSVMSYPNNPFALPFFGTETINPADWLDDFGGLRSFFRIDEIKHAKFTKKEIVGAVISKSGYGLLQIAFNRDGPIHTVVVKGFPLHERISYEHPESTTRSGFESVSKWTTFEGVSVPVSVRFMSQNGPPDHTEKLEADIEVTWKLLKNEDEWFTKNALEGPANQLSAIGRLFATE